MYQTVQQLKDQGSVPIVPTQIILHSLANGWSWDGGVGWLLDPANPLESHYAIRRDGYRVQLVPDTQRAEANYGANRRADGTGAISVETDSDRDAVEPWTPDQVASITELLVAKCREYNIPPRLCRSADDPGIGWHVMWGAPGAWTPVAKTCPGPARIAQLRDEIVPEVYRQVTQPTKPSTPEPTTTTDLEINMDEKMLRKLIREEATAATRTVLLNTPVIGTKNWTLPLILRELGKKAGVIK